MFSAIGNEIYVSSQVPVWPSLLENSKLIISSTTNSEKVMVNCSYFPLLLTGSYLFDH